MGSGFVYSALLEKRVEKTPQNQFPIDQAFTREIVYKNISDIKRKFGLQSVSSSTTEQYKVDMWVGLTMKKNSQPMLAKNLDTYGTRNEFSSHLAALKTDSRGKWRVRFIRRNTRDNTRSACDNRSFQIEPANGRISLYCIWT